MLARFARYLERTWDFSDTIGSFTDSRAWSKISTSSVYLSCFGMFVLRLQSFNALEAELKLPHRWEAWVGKEKPSADTLGYVLERIDLFPLRSELVRINHQMKRKKILRSKCPPYFVAAIDGHELFSSFKRTCDRCLEREIEVKGEKVTQYYHRVVVLQIVNAWPCLILDMEPILPGEGEVSAAERMLERAKKLYPRFFDILTLDALYLSAPFLKKVQALGWEAVVVLKQENRDLYGDVEGLMKMIPPKTVQIAKGETQRWDMEGLTTWPQMGRPMRVVVEQTTQTKRERVARKWRETMVESHWRSRHHAFFPTF